MAAALQHIDRSAIRVKGPLTSPVGMGRGRPSDATNYGTGSDQVCLTHAAYVSVGVVGYLAYAWELRRRTK